MEKEDKDGEEKYITAKMGSTLQTVGTVQQTKDSKTMLLKEHQHGTTLLILGVDT